MQGSAHTSAVSSAAHSLNASACLMASRRSWSPRRLASSSCRCRSCCRSNRHRRQLCPIQRISVYKCEGLHVLIVRQAAGRTVKRPDSARTALPSQSSQDAIWARCAAWRAQIVLSERHCSNDAPAPESCSAEPAPYATARSCCTPQFRYRVCRLTRACASTRARAPPRT